MSLCAAPVPSLCHVDIPYTHASACLPTFLLTYLHTVRANNGVAHVVDHERSILAELRLPTQSKERRMGPSLPRARSVLVDRRLAYEEALLSF